MTASRAIYERVSDMGGSYLGISKYLGVGTTPDLRTININLGIGLDFLNYVGIPVGFFYPIGGYDWYTGRSYDLGE